MKNQWIKITASNPMPDTGFFLTKIEDEKGTRNITELKRQKGRYFLQDGTYVYYSPTHYLN